MLRQFDVLIQAVFYVFFEFGFCNFACWFVGKFFIEIVHPFFTEKIGVINAAKVVSCVFDKIDFVFIAACGFDDIGKRERCFVVIVVYLRQKVNVVEAVHYHFVWKLEYVPDSLIGFGIDFRTYGCNINFAVLNGDVFALQVNFGHNYLLDYYFCFRSSGRALAARAATCSGFLARSS